VSKDNALRTIVAKSFEDLSRQVEVGHYLLLGGRDLFDGAAFLVGPMKAAPYVIGTTIEVVLDAADDTRISLGWFLKDQLQWVLSDIKYIRNRLTFVNNVDNLYDTNNFHTTAVSRFDILEFWDEKLKDVETVTPTKPVLSELSEPSPEMSFRLRFRYQDCHEWSPVRFSTREAAEAAAAEYADPSVMISVHKCETPK